MDFLYLIATTHIRLYMFFQCVFVVPIFSPLFDPTASFEWIPLYIARPDLMPPHMAHPDDVVLPQAALLESSKSDQPEMSASSSSSSFSPADDYALGDPKSASFMANGFFASGFA